MERGWAELESDPGLFSLLIEDFGVVGVQVEEIYDLQKSIEGTVYGFIFLFKWIEERRSRRKIVQEEESFVVDENIVKSMFFAQQMIPNSCATHALISVLLNAESVVLGDMLSELKDFSKNMNSEDKGFAIGNLQPLAKAHNSHARPEAPRKRERMQGLSASRTLEAFHFVSYVPIRGRLFELDGLKSYPIDHGPWGENESWTEKFKRVITERLGMATGGEPYHDIRFNLMAVVPDRRQQYEVKLKTLKTNRQIVLEALQQMVKVANNDLGTDFKNKIEPVMTRSIAAAAREALANHVTSDQEENKDLTSDNDNNNEICNILSNPIIELGNPALDCHSYAKSPVIKTENLKSNDCNSDDSIAAFEDLNESKLTVENSKGDSSIEIKKDSDCSFVSASITNCLSNDSINTSDSDGGTPVSLKTKFVPASPCPSNESTDTASEGGSFVTSPDSSTTSAHSSPNTSYFNEFKSDLEETSNSKDDFTNNPLTVKTENKDLMNSSDASEQNNNSISMDSDDMKMSKTIIEEKLSPRSAKSKFTSQHGFTPKDLLALLKNVDNEIKVTELNLREEVDKRKKYKIDDCRRTHNYDQFICTFLSMLAEQGHLAGLVEQQMNAKKRRQVLQPCGTIRKKHKNEVEISTNSKKRRKRRR